jgi:hypothetical protein
MEELSFDYSSGSFMDDSCGGPPLYTAKTNNDLSFTDKHNAYTSYTSNDGYVLLDFTLLSNTAKENDLSIVNNTAFFVFFCLFLIVLVLILMLVVTGYLNAMVGAYLLLILSVIIYLCCMLYRSHLISQIVYSTNKVNSAIKNNKVNFDNSVIQLPNHIHNITASLSSNS